MRLLVSFARFWWDFIVGEDWTIAAGVVAVLAGGAGLVAGTALSDTAVSLLTGAGIFAVVAMCIVVGALREGREA